MDTYKLVEDAAYLISGAFEWSETMEGHDYWEAIYNRLKQIAKDGELK